QNLRILQRIRVLDGEARDVVEDHVHDADRPDGTVRILPIEGQVVRVLSLFLYVLIALNQEAAGAHGWIVDLLARVRLNELDQQSDHFSGRVKLAPFFASAIGEVLNQVFVGGPKQVGKLEIFIHQDKLRLVKMV